MEQIGGILFALIVAVVTFTFVQAKKGIYPSKEQLKPARQQSYHVGHNLLEFTGSYPEGSTTPENEVVQVKKRYRRMLGHRTRCIPVVKVFCKVFTRHKVTKKFCLTVPMKICWGLD